METPKSLSLAQAKHEAENLRNLNRKLALAFVRAKQLHLARFPERGRPFCQCSYRSDADQAYAYSLGRTRPGRIVTYKQPGQSKHNRQPAEAFDVWLIGAFYEPDWAPDLYASFAAIMHEVDPDVFWGGDWLKFKDLPHFELGHD